MIVIIIIIIYMSIQGKYLINTRKDSYQQGLRKLDDLFLKIEPKFKIKICNDIVKVSKGEKRIKIHWLWQFIDSGVELSFWFM